MAIYHLHTKIIGRSEGRCVVQAAAYRSAEDLSLSSTGESFDFTAKSGVEHTEIMAPVEAPDWVYDREQLWNAVENIEKRKDAQLAREVEVSLPIELDREQQIALMREYVQETFVKRGMVADIAIHRDDPNNPHAHILLTTRSISGEGFGPKVREWNTKSQMNEWRAEWADVQNRYLAREGFEVRVDHRSYAAQGINIEPGQKLGLSTDRQSDADLPPLIKERMARQQDIQRENGARIIAEPKIALDALTQQRATFTERDVARFLNTHTVDAKQFQEAQAKVMASDQLVKLGVDDRGQTRYSTRDMVTIENELRGHAEDMTAKPSHAVADGQIEASAKRSGLTPEQTDAARHVLEAGDLKVVVGVAGSGKSRMLDAARDAWVREGYTVKGAALSGIAAENLQHASGIESRTLASYELSWRNGHDALSSKDVLVIDEAGMLGTRQLDRVMAEADRAGAKVVLVGDAEQLQAIEAGAPFRAISESAGVAELTSVRRQQTQWQQEATLDMASGRTVEALQAYEKHGAITGAQTRDDARIAVLNTWEQGRGQGSQLMLAYTRDDVKALNDGARERLKANGELKGGVAVETERGQREVAAGDRVLFLRNEKSLGVKNGSLGTVAQVNASGTLSVRLDGKNEKEPGRTIDVDPRFYKNIDHGYATTVHKSQGSTVDRTQVLASKSFDRHATYVAMSRHRQEAQLFYARDEFTTPQQLVNTLSRARPKDMATDYAEVRGLEQIPQGVSLSAEKRSQMAKLGADRLAHLEKRFGFDKPNERAPQATRTNVSAMQPKPRSPGRSR